MTPANETSKQRGRVTRALLIQHGLRFASARGLAGVSIAPLAAEAGLRKSSFFAHFATKDELQIALLDTAALLFREHVLVPAGAERSGSRLRRLFVLWLGWSARAGLTGDIFVAASSELDDMPGRVRDHFVSLQEIWLQALSGVIQDAVDAGDLPERVDIKQFTFELVGIYLAFHSTARLMHDATAEERAMSAFERLVAQPPLRRKKQRPQRKVKKKKS